MNNFGQGLNGNFPNNSGSGPAFSNGGLFNNININNFPRYDIVKVHGKSGAEAFQMGPNSKYLLVDEADPIIWFVQTDGAGYKSIEPFSIKPYQPTPPIDLNALEARIAILEDKINGKSYPGTNKQSKKQFRNDPNGTNEAPNSTI